MCSIPFEVFLFRHYLARAVNGGDCVEAQQCSEGTQGGTTKREPGDGVGNDGLQETSRVPLSSVMRKLENEGSLINAKCTIRVCYGLRNPLFTAFSLNFRDKGALTVVEL